MINLPMFVTELMSDTYLGDVDIAFIDARTKGNRLILTTEMDFPDSLFWLMRGDLEVDVSDGSVDLSEEDPNGLIPIIMNATTIGELPEAQACKSEFVRWLTELKYDELTSQGRKHQMGIGQNRDGELVDFNNKCSKCGYPMPLPQSAGKYCPECRTYCPKGRSVPLVVPPKTKVCFFCQKEVPKDALYCIHCGEGVSDKVNAITRKGKGE